MGLHCPCHHFPGLAGGQKTAKHKPSVLRQHTAIVKFQFSIIATHAYQMLGIIHCHRDAMTRLQWQWVYIAIRPSVVIGLEALELLGLLAIGTGNGLAAGISGETIQPAIHHKRLQPIFRGQELQVKACVSHQFLWHRLVQPHGYLHSLSLGGDHQSAIEVIVFIAQSHLYTSLFLVHLAVSHLGHQVPLLWRIVQPHGSALDVSHAMLDNLNARILLVVESAIETVAEYQDVHSLSLKIVAVIESQVLRLRERRGHDGQ